MIDHRDGPAGKLLLAFETNGQRVALAGLAQRRNIVVLINDRIADHEDLEVGQRPDDAVNLPDGPLFGESLEKVSRFRREYAEVLIQQAA